MEKQIINGCIKINIENVNFSDKKPFTVVFCANNKNYAELWLESEQFQNTINTLGENVFENFYDYFKIA